MNFDSIDQVFEYLESLPEWKVFELASGNRFSNVSPNQDNQTKRSHTLGYSQATAKLGAFPLGAAAILYDFTSCQSWGVLQVVNRAWCQWFRRKWLREVRFPFSLPHRGVRTVHEALHCKVASLKSIAEVFV